jgi:hypothetical protein
MHFITDSLFFLTLASAGDERQAGRDDDQKARVVERVP